METTNPGSSFVIANPPDPCALQKHHQLLANVVRPRRRASLILKHEYGSRERASGRLHNIQHCCRVAVISGRRRRVRFGSREPHMQNRVRVGPLLGQRRPTDTDALADRADAHGDIHACGAAGVIVTPSRVTLSKPVSRAVTLYEPDG